MKSTTLSAGRAVWLAVTTLMTLATVGSLYGPWGETRWRNPELLFGMTVGAAALCIVAATIVMAVADRRQLAEPGLLGAALMVASVLPLVHGLVTPGVLYDETAAFRSSAYLTLPIAVIVAAPLLRPHDSFGRWAARHWREWTLLALLAVFAVASAVTFFPDAVHAPDASDPITVASSGLMIAGIVVLSLRQLRFYEIGRRPANLIASISLVMLASTAVLPIVDNDYSPGFWWLHIAGALGVLGACGGLVVAKKVSKSTIEVLGPVLARDPLVAFELGLSPVVHQFVASLDEKDPETRDHVVRTAELAIRVGERFHLPARQLRDLGLAAMLHDVGKLNVPSDVLNKPSRLTAEEYELVKRHAVDGEQMLLAESTLASVAPIVRSHHERIDGRGYPDGLVGRQIPLPARIIAVCDALDAMTHDRQFRPAMPVRMAFAVLNEHAGSQWDAAVIEQVMTVLPSMPIVSGLDAVGRDPERESERMMSELPDDVGALLVAVDAEI